MMADPSLDTGHIHRRLAVMDRLAVAALRRFPSGLALLLLDERGEIAPLTARKDTWPDEAMAFALAAADDADDVAGLFRVPPYVLPEAHLGRGSDGDLSAFVRAAFQAMHRGGGSRLDALLVIADDAHGEDARSRLRLVVDAARRETGTALYRSGIVRLIDGDGCQSEQSIGSLFGEATG